MVGYIRDPPACVSRNERINFIHAEDDELPEEPFTFYCVEDRWAEHTILIFRKTSYQMLIH